MQDQVQGRYAHILPPTHAHWAGCLDSPEHGTVEWNSGMVDWWNSGMVEQWVEQLI